MDYRKDEPDIVGNAVHQPNYDSDTSDRTVESALHISEPTLNRNPSMPQWKRILFEIVLRSITVFFYPIFYLIIVADAFRSKE